MLDIFVSYSRRNLDFVQDLTQALEEQGKAIWFDKKKEPLMGIPAGSKWWDEIKHGIEFADNFLIVVSPESMTSPYCHAEIAHAIAHQKRTVTLLYCKGKSLKQVLSLVDAAIDSIAPDMQLPASVFADVTNVRSLARRNWLKLSQIQYLVYRDDMLWAQFLQSVIDAVDLDIQWLRTWSQFRQAVQIWVENNFDADYLWAESRLKPIREAIEKRQPRLDDDQQKFLQPEQEWLVDELNDETTTHSRRFEIGNRLAIIGDTRRGIGLLDDGHTPDIIWLPVNVPMELSEQGFEFMVDEGIFGEYMVYTAKVQAFFIARFPVTNAQFRIFTADPNGYYNQTWWDEMDEYSMQRIREPLNSNPNAARGTISWFQSVAYARYVTNKLKNLRIVHPQYPDTPFIIGENAEIRLPTEWEWQWAAQNGYEKRVFPWGDWDSIPRANTREAIANSVSIAVGMYPHGAAACGALDIAGNHWEWCLNEFENPDNSTISDDGMARVLRGGAYDNMQINARCAFRAKYHPANDYESYSARLIIAYRN